MSRVRLAAVLLAFACLLLPGCATAPGPPAHARVPVPVRDVLLHAEQEPGDLGAYGYLLFAARPSAKSEARYIAACKAFREQLDDRRLVPSESATLFMVTYWLLAEKADDDCASWLRSYDYPRAGRILSQAGLLDREGPVLVAWPRPPRDLGANSEGLVLDLSPSRVSEADFLRALRAWRAAIVEEPEVWQDGLRYEKARLYMARALDDAPQVLQALAQVVWTK